jgi:hypothetical protein
MSATQQTKPARRVTSGKSALAMADTIDRLNAISAMNADDDIYLIRLCGEFGAHNTRYLAMIDAFGIEDGSPADHAHAAWHDMLAEIKDITPRTMPGFIAKARVVAIAIRSAHEEADGDLGCLDFDEEIALTLAENLIAFGEVLS